MTQAEIVKSEVLLLAGLPGCGKTTYVNDLRREGWCGFDDFKSVLSTIPPISTRRPDVKR